jgi:hypothetical protein
MTADGRGWEVKSLAKVIVFLKEERFLAEQLIRNQSEK